MPKNDIETLKAWAHWKRKDIERNPDTFSDPEGEMELVTAVDNVISQVGTWKAKYEALVDKYGAVVDKYSATVDRIISTRNVEHPAIKSTWGHTGPCQPGCTCTASWSARNAEDKDG